MITQQCADGAERTREPDPPTPSEQTELRLPAGECRRCHGNSRVIDVNDAPLGAIRRRRKCLDCGWRWTTREYAE